MSVLGVFAECNRAVVEGVLIERAARSDKEFHFQNWFVGRLQALALNYDPPRRNTYPDFRLVASAVGFELKGLAFPGRWASFDCNSQVCTGFHNGRSIYYVFGRYPTSRENQYPVLDLVVCHGNFLNARHDHIHENKSFRGFGSYGAARAVHPWRNKAVPASAGAPGRFALGVFRGGGVWLPVTLGPILFGGL
jgi:hypothetical protein